MQRKFVTVLVDFLFSIFCSPSSLDVLLTGIKDTPINGSAVAKSRSPTAESAGLLKWLKKKRQRSEEKTVKKGREEGREREEEDGDAFPPLPCDIDSPAARRLARAKEREARQGKATTTNVPKTESERRKREIEDGQCFSEGAKESAQYQIFSEREGVANTTADQRQSGRGENSEGNDNGRGQSDRTEKEDLNDKESKYEIVFDFTCQLVTELVERGSLYHAIHSGKFKSDKSFKVSHVDTSDEKARWVASSVRLVFERFTTFLAYLSLSCRFDECCTDQFYFFSYAFYYLFSLIVFILCCPFSSSMIVPIFCLTFFSS